MSCCRWANRLARTAASRPGCSGLWQTTNHRAGPTVAVARAARGDLHFLDAQVARDGVLAGLIIAESGQVLDEHPLGHPLGARQLATRRQRPLRDQSEDHPLGAVTVDLAAGSDPADRRTDPQPFPDPVQHPRLAQPPQIQHLDLGRGHNADDRRSSTQNRVRHANTDHKAPRINSPRLPSSTGPVNGHYAGATADPLPSLHQANRSSMHTIAY